MGLASAANRNDYTGNDATSVYPYSYRIFQDTDILVTVRKIDDGTETTLVKGTDYSVDGVGSSTGGNVNLIDNSQIWLTSGSLAHTYKLTARRVRPITQNTDIRNQGDFFPEVHEDAFDHGIMVGQQHQDEIDRSVKLPETVSGDDFDTRLPANLADFPGSAITVNDTGDGFDIGAATSFSRLGDYDTYANLKAKAAAHPSLVRLGWAYDIEQLVFYTTNGGIGDNGWIVVGG